MGYGWAETGGGCGRADWLRKVDPLGPRALLASLVGGVVRGAAAEVPNILFHEHAERRSMRRVKDIPIVDCSVHVVNEAPGPERLNSFVVWYSVIREINESVDSRLENRGTWGEPLGIEILRAKRNVTRQNHRFDANPYIKSGSLSTVLELNPNSCHRLTGFHKRLCLAICTQGRSRYADRNGGGTVADHFADGGFHGGCIAPGPDDESRFGIRPLRDGEERGRLRSFTERQVFSVLHKTYDADGCAGAEFEIAADDGPRLLLAGLKPAPRTGPCRRLPGRGKIDRNDLLTIQNPMAPGDRRRACGHCVASSCINRSACGWWDKARCICDAELENFFIYAVPNLEALADTLRTCQLRERSRRGLTTFVKA